MVQELHSFPRYDISPEAHHGPLPRAVLFNIAGFFIAAVSNSTITLSPANKLARASNSRLGLTSSTLPDFGFFSSRSFGLSSPATRADVTYGIASIPFHNSSSTSLCNGRVLLFSFSALCALPAFRPI